jgi:hypothetical protein
MKENGKGCELMYDISDIFTHCKSLCTCHNIPTAIPTITEKNKNIET